MSIPLINMKGFTSCSWTQKLALANQFGKALQKVGFVAVTNVGINSKTVDAAYEAAVRYFSQPEEEKLRQRSRDGFRGYVPFKQEHAKDSIHGDLKSFYHTTGPTQPENLWPQLKGFKEPILALYQELSSCLSLSLEAVTIYLGCKDTSCLVKPLEAAGGLMRLLHYPPISENSNALRSAPHEDIGIMTVIPRATEAGLQVKTSSGNWIDVEVPKNAAIINAGDTLQYITAGRIPSTTHRVINVPCNRPRYSIPFFGNFPFDYPLKVLETCKTSLSSFPEITYGQFLNARYKDIGLTK